APVGVLAGHDDAGLVGVLAGRHGGIDRHDDPDEIGNILVRRPARLFDQPAGPKGARHVVQYLGVELLPAEPGALVLAYDLLQKRRREVGPIVVCRAARDHRGGVGDQLADDLDRLGGGGDDDARVGTQAQPEHQHVPGLWIPPGGYFITPRRVVLRPSQALRLVGAVGCRNGPVRPGQPALGWLVSVRLLRWPDRQHAALAFDHDVAGIGCGRRDQRDPAAAVMDDLVANALRTAAGLAKAATGQEQPRPPIAFRRLLVGPPP